MPLDERASREHWLQCFPRCWHLFTGAPNPAQQCSSPALPSGTLGRWAAPDGKAPQWTWQGALHQRKQEGQDRMVPNNEEHGVVASKGCRVPHCHSCSNLLISPLPSFPCHQMQVAWIPLVGWFVHVPLHSHRLCILTSQTIFTPSFVLLCI